MNPTPPATSGKTARAERANVRALANTMQACSLLPPDVADELEWLSFGGMPALAAGQGRPMGMRFYPTEWFALEPTPEFPAGPWPVVKEAMESHRLFVKWGTTLRNRDGSYWVVAVGPSVTLCDYQVAADQAEALP